MDFEFKFKMQIIKRLFILFTIILLPQFFFFFLTQEGLKSICCLREKSLKPDPQTLLAPEIEGFSSSCSHHSFPPWFTTTSQIGLWEKEVLVKNEVDGKYSLEGREREEQE